MLRVLPTLLLVTFASGCLIVGYEAEPRQGDGAPVPGLRTGDASHGDGDGDGDGDRRARGDGDGDGDGDAAGDGDGDGDGGGDGDGDGDGDGTVPMDAGMPPTDGGMMSDAAMPPGDAAVGCPGGCDDGDPCTSDACTPFGCAFATVYPACKARGDCPSACDFLYSMGALGEDCDTHCGTLGLSCGGAADVGSRCQMYREVDGCNDEGFVIYRDWLDDQRCVSSWGNTRACDNNYNIGNAYCCKCQEP